MLVIGKAHTALDMLSKILAGADGIKITAETSADGKVYVHPGPEIHKLPSEEIEKLTLPNGQRPIPLRDACLIVPQGKYFLVEVDRGKPVEDIAKCVKTYTRGKVYFVSKHEDILQHLKEATRCKRLILKLDDTRGNDTEERLVENDFITGVIVPVDYLPQLGIEEFVRRLDYLGDFVDKVFIEANTPEADDIFYQYGVVDSIIEYADGVIVENPKELLRILSNL
ncbi:hypothetical protein [Pyrococcus kukulkanii]|uniref:Uncharacterized protein n=1 Tax=Pyrococcus kukulkanii TaxID=1609559 RepID=A0ABV4T5T1_9EURY